MSLTAAATVGSAETTLESWNMVRNNDPSRPRKSRKRSSRFPVPHPFVKWAGGKRHLVPEIQAHIRRHLPDWQGAYHEPFTGGGALYFHLKPPQAFLSENNQRLVRAYWGIRDDVEGVIARLEGLPNDKEAFLEVRAWDIDDREDDADVAAWLIYLNKTGFNGLYRVNKSNRFNVPYGKNPGATICDSENLMACSKLLRSAHIAFEDFTAVVDRAQPGDFVYFDPPYVPLTRTASFTSYTRDSFGPDDQARLRNVARELKERGVHVLLSNSSAQQVYDLYDEGFDRREVQVPRRINSVAARRGNIAELLIW